MDKIINDSSIDQQFENFLMTGSVWLGREGRNRARRKASNWNGVLRNAPDGAKQMTVLSIGCLISLHQGCTIRDH
jgi:hypothetical protein